VRDAEAPSVNCDVDVTTESTPYQRRENVYSPSAPSHIDNMTHKIHEINNIAHMLETFHAQTTRERGDEKGLEWTQRKDSRKETSSIMRSQLGGMSSIKPQP
jgi:hypothetical protein